MPPRLPRIPIGLSESSRVPTTLWVSSTCLFCSLARCVTLEVRSCRILLRTRRLRNSSTNAAISPSSSSLHKHAADPRSELRNALLDLRNGQSHHINITRLQLALHGLQQQTGEETIRIAVMALADVKASFEIAKELLRLMLADPLKAEEKWEARLLQHKRGDKPLQIKVRGDGEEGIGPVSNLLNEMIVSSPLLNRHKLEIILLEVDPQSTDGNIQDVLSPITNIPTSSTGRQATVAVPVHKALMVGKGIRGVAVLSPSRVHHEDIASPAVRVVDMQVDDNDRETLDIIITNVSLGRKALGAFRTSQVREVLPEREWSFANDWRKSGIPEVMDVLFTGTASNEGAMKETLRNLISAILSDAHERIEADRARQMTAARSAKLSSTDLMTLKEDLSQWAERAHSELRMQLEIAFHGRRWSKLAWWKLFWRVDDVSMILANTLAQRYLPYAKEEIIYLAGVMAGKGLFDNTLSLPRGNWVYKPIREHFEAPREIEGAKAVNTTAPSLSISGAPWPLDIPVSRNALRLKTVPRLQALAQKLVLHTLTTTSISCALSGLIYISSFSLNIYESGAVAALGTVWALRRMQRKWDEARSYWKKEVHEEARKAIRGIELAVADALRVAESPIEISAEVEVARTAVEQAEDALDACR